VGASLPVVVSVTERTPEGRFPNFRGIMRARKKPMQTLSLADLGLGPDASRSVVVSAAARPARQAGTKVVDEGDGGRQLAQFLVEKKLI